MKTKLTRTFALVIATTLILMLCVACGGGEPVVDSTASSNATGSTNSASTNDSQTNLSSDNATESNNSASTDNAQTKPSSDTGSIDTGTTSTADAKDLEWKSAYAGAIESL
jgi:hypothetical protein